MGIRCLGLVLLIWFPGEVQASSGPPSCSAPSLENGFFTPNQQTYSHGTSLTYTCNDGYKPVEEGWWATSICQNGRWSHEPLCISFSEKPCIPSAISDEKYTGNLKGWFNDGYIVRTICGKGYKLKDPRATAECINGSWTSVPACEKSIFACTEPPEIPNAVMFHRGRHEWFFSGSVVEYECKDGYTAEGTGSNKTIYCVGGIWTEGPTCRPSGSSGSDERGPEIHITQISNCAKPPSVPNGYVVETLQIFLKYQCRPFYKREGPETVVCYSDGSWSRVPTCKVAFCSVDTGEHPELRHVGVIYIKDGDSAVLGCEKPADEWMDFDSVGTCRNGQMRIGSCHRGMWIK